MNSLANIKRAFKAGDWTGCRALCKSSCPEPDGTDDEISLILAECDTGIGEEEFLAGHLHSACRFFDDSIRYADECLYPLPQIEAQAAVCFGYMERWISPMLGSDVLDDRRTGDVIADSLFAMESRICRARCFAISSRFGDSVVSSYCEKRLSSPKPMIL